MRNHALWIMPSGDVYERLSGLIRKLAEEYSTPVFEPHITLAGGLIGDGEDVISKTSQLASLIKPYEVMLTTVEYLDEYFKCLFIKVEETAGIMNAHLQAKKVFALPHDTKYMPHLSLMYGSLTPEKKEEIIKETGKRFDMSFEVKSLHLYCVEGEPEAWHRVKEFSLE
jgi:2'-5' RNA ligase